MNLVRRPSPSLMSLRIPPLRLATFALSTALIIGPLATAVAEPGEPAGPVRVYLGVHPVQPPYEVTVDGSYVLVNGYVAGHFHSPDPVEDLPPDADVEELESRYGIAGGQLYARLIEQGLDGTAATDSVAAWLDSLPNTQVVGRKGSTLKVLQGDDELWEACTPAYNTPEALADLRRIWSDAPNRRAEEILASIETSILLIGEGHSTCLGAQSDADVIALTSVILAAFAGERTPGHQLDSTLEGYMADERRQPMELRRLAETDER